MPLTDAIVETRNLPAMLSLGGQVQGGVASPLKLAPQQATVPSCLTPHVCLSPAETDKLRRPVAGVLLAGRHHRSQPNNQS
jgi:hypothetical protein